MGVFRISPSSYVNEIQVDSIKVVEFLNNSIDAEVTHDLPNGNTYTMSSGSKLDVYFNGQLLTHDSLEKLYDYVEVFSNSIKFHFNVPSGTLLVYIIK